MAYGQRAFGLREIKITDANGANPVAFPVAIVLHVTEEIDTEEFLVDGIRKAVSSQTTGVSWEVEAGGLSLEAYAKLTGRTAVLTGTTPNQVLTTTARSGEFPYIRIYGRARDDELGDVHCKIYRTKLVAIEGSFREGQFWVTSCAGIAVEDSTLGFYEFVQHETALAL